MQFNWRYLITKDTLEKGHNANLKGEMAVVEVNQRQEETSQTNNDAKQKKNVYLDYLNHIILNYNY